MKENVLFDISAGDTSNHYLTMNELMASYRSFLAAKDYENAKITLEYGIRCGHLPAKIALARLLANVPHLKMAQKERYQQAEKLYLEVLNLLNPSILTEAELTMELASLYEHDRPIAQLGSLLKAQRLGYSIRDEDIEDCRRQLSRIDINSLGEHPEDCYLLGTELYIAGGAFRFAEFFLREACETEKQELAGRACLCLANLYDENSYDVPNHRLESIKFYRLAAEKGFPEFISRKNRVKP